MIDQFKGQYSFLSNFYKSFMTYMGFYVPTSEHAFQLAKGVNIEDMRYVSYASTPLEAKKRGRWIQLRPDWESVKDDVMYEILIIKFHNLELRQKLIETHPQPLIEGNNWGDTYWGLCKGEGENKLGKLLMKVRNEICSATCT